MKILLAGPGTGKTTKVKTLIQNDFRKSENILVLSFTNATVNDLKNSFKNYNNVKSYTLHSYALKINHLPQLHVLNDQIETPKIRKFTKVLDIHFEEFCSIIGCITFQNMTDGCIQFIKANPAYATENIGELDLLIVDEFQDFNENERELVSLVSQYAKETFILGDDDQSIYGFKDADPDGIISKYNDDDVEKIAHENICYRCPDVIVEHCANLISRNKHRVDKEWLSSKKDGNLIFKQFMTHQETHKYICAEIKKINNNSNESILILSPVRYYISDLINELNNENIEYLDFWSNNIDSNLLEQIWWLKAIYSKHRVIFLLFLALKFNYLRRKKFLDLIKLTFQKDYEEQSFIKAIVDLGLYPSPYANYLLSPIPIEEFFKLHPEFEMFKDFIDEDDLFNCLQNLEKIINPNILFSKDKVNIMSIHKSKGLQANHVFIIGLNDGIIPNEITGIDTIEAQRRLLFVGMTRALKSLYMISTVSWEGKFVNRVDKSQFKYIYKKKIYHGRTSRFVEEMRK